MASLRAESLQPPACPSKTRGVKRRLLASIGCVMVRSFGMLKKQDSG